MFVSSVSHGSSSLQSQYQSRLIASVKRISVSAVRPSLPQTLSAPSVVKLSTIIIFFVGCELKLEAKHSCDALKFQWQLSPVLLVNSLSWDEIGKSQGGNNCKRFLNVSFLLSCSLHCVELHCVLLFLHDYILQLIFYLTLEKLVSACRRWSQRGRLLQPFRRAVANLQSTRVRQSCRDHRGIRRSNRRCVLATRHSI